MNKVKDLMISAPKSCFRSDTLQTVARKMLLENADSLPVVNEKNQVLGMITDHQVVLAWGRSESRPMHALSVADAEIITVPSVLEQDGLETALKIMRTSRKMRLPVVDGNQRLVGVITLNSVVRKLNSRSKNEPFAPEKPDPENKIISVLKDSSDYFVRNLAAG